jgi:hypothetical protein
MVNLVIGAILGAALALASQLFLRLRVEPGVDARKRWEDRWERNVRDLIELLMTSLNDRASSAHGVQEVFSCLGAAQDAPGQDRDGIAKLRADHAWEVRKATRAFADLAYVRVAMLIREIVGPMATADEVIQLGTLAQKYWTRVEAVNAWSQDDTYEEIEDRWDDEFQARADLICQAGLLVDLGHPPRVPLRRRLSQSGAVPACQAISAESP